MPAPKKNTFAQKPAKERKSARRMVNLTPGEDEQIEKHLENIDMTWADWSRAVIRQALADES